VTLIELMVAITIFGILLMAGADSYTRWIQNQQIRVAAESVLSGMQVARNEAVKRNVTVQFVLGANGWTVIDAASVSQVQAAPLREGARNAIVTVTPAGASMLTFNGLGRVWANADASPPIAQVDVTSVSAAADRPLRVLAGLGGALKMCDPALAAGDPRGC
jgi:type IV fimbrial biogenesis protein FimT